MVAGPEEILLLGTDVLARLLAGSLAIIMGRFLPVGLDLKQLPNSFWRSCRLGAEHVGQF